MHIINNNIKHDVDEIGIPRISNTYSHYGITVMSCVTVILIITAYFIKYPDILYAQIQIVGSNPTVRLVSNSNGIISEIHIADNQQVKQGEYLVVMRNSASTTNVLSLKSELEKLIQPDSQIKIDNLDKEYFIGNLQSTYSQLYLLINEYNEFKNNKYYLRRLEILNKRNEALVNQSIYAARENVLLLEQLNYINKIANRDSNLYNKGAVSLEDYEKSKTNVLNHQVTYEASNLARNQILSEIIEVDELILANEKEFMDLDISYRSKIQAKAMELLNEIESWELQYVLKSPIDGIVSINNLWSVNSNVLQNEEILTVTPLNEGNIIVNALINPIGMGRIAVGQKANIYIDNYPSNEYGILKGVVAEIAETPSRSIDGQYAYKVIIALPNGLETTYGMNIPFSHDLFGKAEIITKDISVLERIINPIHSTFDKHQNILR